MSSKAYKEEWSKFYDDYRECFNPPIPAAEIEQYMPYFAKRYGPLYSLSHPSYYKLDFLKTLVGKLAFSYFVPDQRFGQRFVMGLQFSPAMHGSVSIAWSARDSKLILSPFQLCAANANDAIEFFKNAAIYEHEEDVERSVGFK